MTAQENVQLSADDQKLIVTYAVLTGLTPLIPIPFVDDMAKTFFRRQLVRGLAVNHGLTLAETDAQILADEAGGSCLLGCLGTALIYPLKWIFRKVFFLLEWKRAIDTVSRTYYHGFLTACAFEGQHCAPAGTHAAKRVRAAMDETLAQTDTSVVNRAARGAFGQSKTALRAAVATLTAQLQRLRGKTQDEITRAMHEVEPEEQKQVADASERLRRAVGELPAAHFEELRARFAAALTS